MTRCEYRHSWIVLGAPSLKKVRQGRCRGICSSQLGWMWHCCWAFPLAALFWPSIIPALCLEIGCVWWPRVNEICTPPFCRHITLQKQQVPLSWTIWADCIPFIICQYGRKECSALLKSCFTCSALKKTSDLAWGALNLRRWERMTKGDHAQIFSIVI